MPCGESRRFSGSPAIRSPTYRHRIFPPPRAKEILNDEFCMMTRLARTCFVRGSADLFSRSAAFTSPDISPYQAFSVTCRRGLFWRSFCHVLLGVPTVSCNWLIFSMLSAFVGEKALFRPFVFKMFSALGVCAVIGHKVAMQSVAAKARRCGIIHPFLLRVRGSGSIRCRGGGIYPDLIGTPPCGEVNSPLQRQTAPLPASCPY